MKENNNIEKGTLHRISSFIYRFFYGIFSFILSGMGLRGLLYYFFPLPEISQWQKLKARAEEQILDLEKKQKNIKKIDNTFKCW